VRVVAVDDFDATPCGGTHCATTAGVGLVRVEGVERYKGGLRVSFSAGARARRRLIERSEALEALERRFTCDAAGVMRAVDKLSRAAADTREALAQTSDSLASRLAAELAEPARPIIIADLGSVPVDLARSVAQALTAHPDTAVLLAVQVGDQAQLIASRSADSDFDCGGFVKRAAAAAGGRGGGRPNHAEARVPGPLDWAGVASAAL
jgi:alanyl-tRNA synthetase